MSNTPVHLTVFYRVHITALTDKQHQTNRQLTQVNTQGSQQ